MKTTSAGWNKALFLWAVVSFLCMLVIFLASSQAAEDSGRLSGSLARMIFGTIWRWFAPSGQEIQPPVLKALEVLLRKAAHLFLYFLLGFCAASTIRQKTGIRRRVFLISLCWCSFFAATDEFHQFFVPGRSGMWQDWLLDTVAASLGIATVVFLIMRKKIKRQI